jgi:hypothetical protein
LKSLSTSCEHLSHNSAFCFVRRREEGAGISGLGAHQVFVCNESSIMLQRAPSTSQPPISHRQGSTCERTNSQAACVAALLRDPPPILNINCLLALRCAPKWRCRVCWRCMYIICCIYLNCRQTYVNVCAGKLFHTVHTHYSIHTVQNGQVKLRITPQGVKVIRFDLHVPSSDAFCDIDTQFGDDPLTVNIQFVRGV